MSYSFFDKNNWNSWFKVTYYASNTWQNYKIDYAHSHDRLEILYVYYGELTLLYSDGKEWKEVTLYSNDYILIDADILHAVRTGSCMSHVFTIELKLVPDGVSGMKYTLRHLISCDKAVNALFMQDERVIRLSDTGHVASMMREIQQCLEDANMPRENYFDLLTSAMFAAIGNDFYRQQCTLRNGIKYLRRALDYIASNFHHEITCGEIADYSGVTLNYLNRLFFEQFAMTVNAYVNHLRIMEAKRLIERTDIPLTEIYRQVGYKTNQNFSKQFTKQAGCSPSLYRKQLKEMHAERNFEKNTNVVCTLPE